MCYSGGVIAFESSTLYFISYWSQLELKTRWKNTKNTWRFWYSFTWLSPTNFYTVNYDKARARKRDREKGTVERVEWPFHDKFHLRSCWKCVFVCVRLVTHIILHTQHFMRTIPVLFYIKVEQLELLLSHLPHAIWKNFLLIIFELHITCVGKSMC